MSEQTAFDQTNTSPANGRFSWTEFAVNDLEASKTFYSEVFGWKFKIDDPPQSKITYLEFGLEEQQNFGGMFEMNPEFYGGEMPAPHGNIYVTVDDVDATANQAVELGGKLLSDPIDLPNVGRLCQIEDPTGAKLFIITLCE